MRRFLLSPFLRSLLLLAACAACHAQSAPVPAPVFSPAPVSPSAAAPPGAAVSVPHYRYAATYEMKQDASTSFRPEGVATDVPGRLFVCAGRQGIAVYVNGQNEGYIGPVNLNDARQAVDDNGQPITGDTFTDPVFRARDPKGEPFVLIDGHQSLPIFGHLWHPVGVCALPGQAVAAVDSFTGYVQVFQKGVKLGGFEVPVPPDGHSDDPGRLVGLAVDGKAFAYVLDSQNGCVIKVRTRDNAFMRAFGAKRPPVPAASAPAASKMMDAGLPGPDPAPAATDDTLSAPVALALHPVSGNVYVADGGHSRIAVYGATGKFQFAFGSPGAGDGQFSHLGGVAFDAQQRVYVADGKRVEVFTDQGRYLTQFGDVSASAGAPASGRTGSDPRASLTAAGGVAIDSEGTVYVADPFAYNVKVYKPDAR